MMERTLVVVNREGMGEAPVELQSVLIINFFKNLIKGNKIPKALFFYADGAKLAVKGSIIEDSLAELSERGCEVMTCTTCLNFYNLKDKLSVGRRAGIPDLHDWMEKCDKVITL